MAKKRTSTKKQPATSKPRKKRSYKLSRRANIILGSALMLISILLITSFISFLFNWREDANVAENFLNRTDEAKNWVAILGASISNFFIFKFLGIASFIFPVLLFITGLFKFFALEMKKLWNIWFWGCLNAIWISLFFGFFFKQAPLLGGTTGYELNDFLRDYIGNIGIALLLVFGLVFYLVMRFNVTPERLGIFFKKKKEEIEQDFANTNESTATAILKTDQGDLATADKASSEKKSSFEVSVENLQPTITNYSGIDTVNDADVFNSFEIKTPTKEEIIEEPTLTSTSSEKKEKEKDAVAIEVEKIVEEKTVKGNLSDKLVEDFGEFDPTLELGNYTFPTLELLKDYEAGSSITINQEELEENKNRIVETLGNYKIGIAQIKATIGPTVTLYEIVPEAGIRISKIKNLEDDIALSLSALGIRIIAPIPGKGTIGIEVPNKKPAIVSMRSVIGSQKFQKAEMELPLALGKNISNETFVVDLAKMPHLLMAGATGQGKSVGLNAILTSLLYKKHPAEVKFVLVDPKKVELTLFNKIERHYLAKLPDSEEAIITDNNKVINTLNSLCIEMDNRYELLKNAMCRNIKEYNKKFKARKLNPNDGHKFLPYIVLVVDEFADLIMTAGKEVETPIARLAQLARAIGIHLIIATQRPSVNVITGIIKANFPARVAFRVTSKIDSRTILDGPGADQLIGRGDMLYTQGNDLIRLQCAFVDTPEVEKITEFIGSQRAYPDAHLLPEYVGEDSGTSLDIDINDRDALFKEAAEVIVIAQQGSASLLQRKLKLGYNRAGRIIDQLEAAGVVGPFEGSKARQVLVPDVMALEQLLQNE
ncbi:DNA translocase FtsK [Sungkyunkwania multivorans]|uniref:DNA translocase FtsK n=1 Tax=Sungkyunkwania multivorans TaxID=1173618 RepID=A0ABW3CT47_9FLAO